MLKDDIRRMLFVLGKEHCLDIMINLYRNDWQTASGAAKDLNLHVATAVKYLSELHELGLVNKRIKRGKTREAFEYQLKTQDIRIEFEIKSLVKKSSRPDNKPLVLFVIFFIMFRKSRKVVGKTVEEFVNGRFEKLKNGEKKVVMDSLSFEGDLDDAKDIFLKNLNGSALTEERCEEVQNALSDLIESVIVHYESKLGRYSTESLVDVTMNKVIDILGEESVDSDDVLGSLPYEYFGKWGKEIIQGESRELIGQEAQDK